MARVSSVVESIHPEWNLTGEGPCGSFLALILGLDNDKCVRNPSTWSYYRIIYSTSFPFSLDHPRKKGRKHLFSNFLGT